MGLLIGFAGVGLVLAPKLAGSGVGSLTVLTVAAALASVLAVTGGTIVQKRLAETHLWTAASIQSVGAALVAVAVTVAVGTSRWDATPILWGALVWSVLVPSMVGTTLLMWMIRHGDATQVTALLLLVPPSCSDAGLAVFPRDAVAHPVRRIRPRLGRSIVDPVDARDIRVGGRRQRNTQRPQITRVIFPFTLCDVRNN